MNALRLIGILAAKDLRIEYRSRHAFLTTLFFALLILIIFNFAFDPGNQSIKDAAPGILWVSLLFPGVIQLNRSFQSEREEGTLYGLILAPIDRGVLFFGKFLANFFLLALVDLFVLGSFFIFYNLTFSTRLGWLFLLMLLVGIVFSSVGTLFAAMVSSVRARDVLLPILLFPILVPVVIAAVNATREVLGTGELEFFWQWLRLLVASDVVFIAGSFLVFDYVVEE
ncbi:MAG: heme exporter protein CcmB [Acidobacteriota bacterium]|nr:MAG: heme exporter protein CcmB [Acidobacteriota bacterium]